MSNRFRLNTVLLIIVVVNLLFTGCSSNSDREKHGQGLIGAYYGEADLTRIKYAELLTRLEQQWDEETGHGSSWSGQYEGMIIAPATGRVTFHLSTTKQASLELNGAVNIEASGEKEGASASIEMKKDRPYHLKIKYLHAGGGEGGFNVQWSWNDQENSAIPPQNLFYTGEQARYWNWLPEPDPDAIDRSQFIVPQNAKHVIVYHETGRFGGWPANNGIWVWGDEILVGFTLAYYQAKELHHSVDETQPQKSMLARSLDGGETWSIEDPDNFVGDGGKPVARTGDIYFGHPDFAYRCNGKHFFVSYKRGKNWQGPYELPDFGVGKLTSRTDYIVNGEDDCLLFLSAEEDRVQARMQDRAFCARTTDGGKTFDFLSWIGEPVTVRSVMPSTVRLSESHLVTALRRRFDKLFRERPRLEKNWIDVYQSKDDGQSWEFLSEVADTDMSKRNGNPPSLVRLTDGRLCVTYGYRAVPYGIRAKLSSDDGKTWGAEVHIRDDARSWDIGYTRSVQRADGKIVTVYYYTTEEHVEQHIAATIWDPDQVGENK